MCFDLYPAKEVQLFPGLGLYSGIFIIYLQWRSKDSRTATIIFYALCLLYILSTVTVVGDLIDYSIGVSNNSICKNIVFLLIMMQLRFRVSMPSPQLQIDLQSILFRAGIVQATANGCCDFIAQCTLVRILKPLHRLSSVLFT